MNNQLEVLALNAAILCASLHATEGQKPILKVLEWITVLKAHKEKLSNPKISNNMNWGKQY